MAKCPLSGVSRWLLGIHLTVERTRNRQRDSGETHTHTTPRVMMLIVLLLGEPQRYRVGYVNEESRAGHLRSLSW